jgi:signal transduction histidine kinase
VTRPTHFGLSAAANAANAADDQGSSGPRSILRRTSPRRARLRALALTVSRDTEAVAWRESLLRRLLLATAPIFAVATAAAAWTSHEQNQLATALLGGFVPLQVAAIFARRWPFTLRAAILISPLLAAAHLTYRVAGFNGNGSLLAAIAIVIAALLLGRRGMLLVLLLALLAPLLSATAYLNGWLRAEDIMGFSPTEPRAWLRTTLVSASAWAIVGVAITFVVRRIEVSLTQAKQTLRDLRAEQARREAAERERQQAEAAALQAQRLELVGRLAAGVAHDFNNVLGVLGNWAEILRLEAPPGPDQEEAKLAIESAMGQGRALTRRLVALARQDARVVQRVRIDECAESTLRTLGRAIPSGITLDFENRSAGTWVSADETELQQVLFNLVLNARDAIGERGTIRVSTERADHAEPIPVVGGALSPGTWVALSVRDSGPGIDPAIRERIFELFFTTKPVGLGTGLGLATVLRIAQASEGGIALESSPETGTTFTLYLPCVP